MAQFKSAPTSVSGSLNTGEHGYLAHWLEEPVILIGAFLLLAALLAKVLQGLAD